MKKGQIKHTLKKAPKTKEQWVGISKSSAIKLTVEIPEELHKKLLLLSATRSSKDNRIYIKDILVEALEQYFQKNHV